MPRTAVVAAALLGVLAAPEGRAQERADTETESAPTAEDVIEGARKAYRPPWRRERCPEGEAGEIVVCAERDDDSFRVSSPTDDAIAEGRAVPDGIPRAPQLAPPPCDPRSPGCFKFGAPPPLPPMFDYDKIPVPLTPEEAALVYRVEEGQPEGTGAEP